MCRYAETPYKVHYVCVPCRRGSTHPWDGADQRRRLAARNGVSIADTLAARDPYDAA